MLTKPAARDDVLDFGAAVARGEVAQQRRSRARSGRRSRRGPPSDGDGTNRPSTLCSSASPRPVPAAISAMLPPRSASPCLQHVQLRTSLQHRHRVAPSPGDRSAATRGGMPKRLRRRRASTRHGTLVSCAASSDHRTGDAEARRVDRVAPVDRRRPRGTPRSSRSGRRSRASRTIANATRPRPRRRADRTVRAASWCRRCRQRESWQLSTFNSIAQLRSRLSLTSLSFSFILRRPSPGSSPRAEAVCPHLRLIVHGRPPLAGQLVVFTGKLSSLGRKDARALVARLGGATADDVNAKTTMLVVGAEGFGPAPTTGRSPERARGQEQQAEARRGAERAGAARRSRSSPRTSSAGSPACRRPSALKRQYHAMRDLLARYRAASRGSPALPGEVRRHPAGPAHQRRHLFRVSRSRGRSSRRTTSSRSGASFRSVVRSADRVAPGPARVRFPARRRAGEDPRRCSAASQPPPRAAGRRRRRRPRRDTRAGRGVLPRRRRRSTMATSRRSRRRRRRTGRRSSSIRIWSPR